MAEAEATGAAAFTAAVTAALAAQAAAAAPVSHVAVKLPDFWVKDPKMWFSQAEAHLAAANHAMATEMATHADVLWDARNTASVSAVADSLAAVSVRSASPDRRAKSPDRRATSPERRRDNGRQPPSRPHLAAEITRNSATTTGLPA